MAATNHTPVIDLTQYINTDKPAYLTDHNSDMLKIDTAIGADRTRLDTLESNQTGTGGLTERITQAESDIDSLETNVTSIGGRTGVLETEYSALEGRVDTLEDTADDQARAIQGTTQLAYTIGNPYDSTVTYSVGDYAIVNNTLYKCIAAVTTGEAFDPNKWQSVKVMSEIGQGGASTAAAVTYDNTASGLTATNVQGAIDEIVATNDRWINVSSDFDFANARIVDRSTTNTSIDTSNCYAILRGNELRIQMRYTTTKTANTFSSVSTYVGLPEKYRTGTIIEIPTTTVSVNESGELLSQNTSAYNSTNHEVEFTTYWYTTDSTTGAAGREVAIVIVL